MYKEINPYELDIICQYVPDREPTAKELVELEREVPTIRELGQALINTTDDTMWKPNPSIILEEQVNEKDGYKRVIFND